MTAGIGSPSANSSALYHNGVATVYYDQNGISGANSYKNRIINGDMSVSQVNGASSVTVTAAAALNYIIDQWYAYCTGANVTGQQVAGSGAERYVYQLTGAASVTKIGFAQRMEANATYDMNNAPAMIGVSMSNSLLTSVNYNVWYANTTDTFGTLASPTRTLITSGTLTVSSAYTRQFIPVTVPAAATTGIEIEFNVGAQTSGTWKIGRVQYEPVPTGAIQGTAYEVLPYATQLARCQRYYYRLSANGNTAFIVGFNGQNYNTTNCQLSRPNPVVMRATPTLLESAAMTTVNAAGARQVVTIINNNNSTIYTASIDCACGAVLVAGYANFLSGDNSGNGYIGIGCQL